MAHRQHAKQEAAVKQVRVLLDPEPTVGDAAVDLGEGFTVTMVVCHAVTRTALGGPHAPSPAGVASSHELGEPMPKLGVGVIAVLMRTRATAADRTGRGTHGVACDTAGRGSYDVAAGRAGRRLAELGCESALDPAPSPDA